MTIKKLLLLILLSLPLAAQETLPPTHWANAYIDYLKVSGYLPGIAMNQRPFERDELARELLKIRWDEGRISSGDRGILRLLYREFSPEIRQLRSEPGENWRDLFNRAIEVLNLPLEMGSIENSIKPGFYGELYYRDNRKGDGKLAYNAHPTLAASPGKGLTLFANLRVFSEAPDGYIGKEYQNLYGYMEQGYLHYRRDWLSVKVGRDWLQLGPGRNTQLLLSDNSRTFDMYHLQLGKSFLQFSFWGMQLDRQGISRSPSYIANRYLNGHRLSVNIGNRIYIGVSEVALYGGENRFWDMGFSNPLGFYYLHNLNQEPGGSNANLLYNLDWDLYLWPGVNLYGEFLLDDYQIDNAEPGDLEPAELGLMLGVNWASPGGISGTLVNLAYTQVRNRTYNVQAPPHGKYLHRNEEIGHFLGNNFERWDLNLSAFLRPELRVSAFSNITRQGEGSVAGTFNTDFFNFTPAEGYSEPFPFGVVERTWQTGLRVFYKPHHLGYLRLALTYSDLSNAAHREGRKASDMSIRLSAGWEWEKLWR